VGERLSYGLTVLLVIIAQDIATANLLPITDQRLWINTFVVGSFYWVLICNLESVFVAWLFFMGDEHDEKARLEAEKKATEKQNTNGKTGNSTREQDPIVTDVAAGSSFQRDDEEQAGADGESSNSPQDQEASSSEHRHVSFLDDVKDESGDKEESNASPDRRAFFSRMKTAKGPSSGRLSFQQLVLQKNQPAKKRHRMIRKLDTWFFWILSPSYVIFVILMFATNSLWNDGNSLFVEGDEQSA
jgi:hypothetical protein